MQGDEQLERAIYNTIRFFGLSEMPLTVVDIWRSLIVGKETGNVRWHGHHVPSLKEIQASLSESDWLKAKTGSVWGYYFLRSAVQGGTQLNEKDLRFLGKQYVRRKLVRHALAQQKWKITRRVAGRLRWAPFVRMVGGSGSLVMFNTKPQSDLDLFVITKKGRVWTARLWLLALSQLSGRRRKYWDVVAPDKICLNHYITEESLMMDREVRNLWTAQLYARLVPLTGLEVYKKWLEVNKTWIHKWIMCPETDVLLSRLYLRGRKGRRWQKLMEGFLTELPGDILERVAERMQVWAIKRHKQWQRTAVKLTGHDRLVVSDSELAFHPNTKVPEILKQFEEEEGQKHLFISDNARQ